MTLQPPKNTSSKKRCWKIFLLILALLSLGAWALLTLFFISVDRHNRVACASNLRSIGQAILLYTKEIHTLPDSFASLAAECEMNPEYFLCGSSTDDYQRTLPPADQYKLCDHLSYIYLPSGQSPDILNNPNFILAHEKHQNHHNDGFNVLFADGHVDWIPKNQMTHILAELKAGHNPPRDPQVPPAPSPAFR